MCQQLIDNFAESLGPAERCLAAMLLIYKIEGGAPRIDSSLVAVTHL